MCENVNFTVLGLDVVFKPGANMERVRSAVRLLEERFAELRLIREGQSRDALLTFLALGLADDVLQRQKELGDVQRRVATMLSLIEKTR
ncbi:MAG: cell division protein ZapA [Desulfovibrio sp.]|nr:cell division protein ZapA [Desulfovibrio sp.]